ncbi:MAG TPA: signal peptidase I [Burkholderiales bacterium]
MDFSLILFVLVVATGLIWALDRWAWAEARVRAAKAVVQAGGSEEAARRAAREPLYVEYARAFFPVILVVFVLRSFVVEPFRIPSGSMLPSLLVGDFILVNKFSYGIRLPIINTKILDLGSPERGDVAVFRFPRDESINYIKRVIGLPGDHIRYEGKRLYINGELVPQGQATAYTVQHNGEVLYEAARMTERLGNVEHAILISPTPDHSSREFVVPPGHYFVMGDNRDHSNDSRYWGFVPEENLVGKAFLIWFSWDSTTADPWFWQRIAFERIGTVIR